MNPIYNVYVLDDNDEIFDLCGEFDTVELAREYIIKLKAQDARMLINDEYAIYKLTEERIE